MGDQKGPRHHYDIIIVGGGPIGSYMAHRSADSGYDVLLIDRKNEIGRPMQCAGLVNIGLFSLPGMEGIKDKVKLKEIYGADIYSPSGKMLPLRGKEVKALSIDRSAFDLELLRSAARSGSEIMIGTEVISASLLSKGGGKVEIVRGKDRYTIMSDLIIGCDGPSSTIRRTMGFDIPQDTIPGVNMEIEIKCGTVPQERVGVLTGNDTAKGFFAWIVPSFGRSGLRIGLSARTGNDVKKGMEKLIGDPRLASFLSLDRLDGEDVGLISSVYGGVPMGPPSKLFKGDCILIGDSAGMAKPTSGGGIFPGMRAVDTLSMTLGDLGYRPGRTLKEFSATWKKGYGKELTKGMVLRKIIRELSDEDIDKAIGALNDRKKLRLINETGDIDQPVSLAVKLLKMDPSLLMLIPRYLPHLKGLL